MLSRNSDVGQVSHKDSPFQNHPPFSLQPTDNNNNSHHQLQQDPSQEEEASKMDSVSSLHGENLNASAEPALPKTTTVSRHHRSVTDLEEHIRLLINQNTSIVETFDPLWSKKYMSSRHHSTSSVPTTTTTSPSSSFYPVVSTVDSSPCKRRYSEVSFVNRVPYVGSRLQSALMAQNSTSTSVVRDLLTSKVSLPMKRLPSSQEDSENRSVIKDLLLTCKSSKSREDLQHPQPQQYQQLSQHPQQQTTCSCGTTFRSQETLEVHKMYYCRPSVLHRRLTEPVGAAPRPENWSSILKNTLEAPKRKMSEPLPPSRTVAARKVSVIQPTADTEESFKRQVSTMLARTSEKQSSLTVVPFSGVSVMPDMKNSSSQPFEMLPDYRPHLSLPLFDIKISSQNHSPQQEQPVSTDKQRQVPVIQESTTATRPTTLDVSGKTPRRSSFNLITSNIVSPDSPRPKKPFSQMYLNGHVYTYIGLKVSTRSTYCCIYRPQPMFVPQETQSKLSMYSNWQTSPPHDSLVEEVSPSGLLAAYDSRRLKWKWSDTKESIFVCAGKKSNDLLTTTTDSKNWTSRTLDEKGGRRVSTIVALYGDDGSSRKISNCEDALAGSPGHDMSLRKMSEDRTSSTSFDSDGDPNHSKRVKIFEGGFKSNEEYTYVRGRGRGKYVCEECGIRCKKPSMLKKHIRTHTDLRPYSCRHCAFAFKTKGNLTKHMKSKAHHKKCVELGIVPVPTTIDESQIDSEALAKQEALERSYNGGQLLSDDDDNEADGDDDDEDYDYDYDEDDEGVPIPFIGSGSGPSQSSPEKIRKINLNCSNHNGISNIGDTGVAVRRTSVIVNKNEEQEVARSLLSLSGSWTESHKSPKGLKVTPSTTSSSVGEDANQSIRRKVSILETTLTAGAWDPRVYMTRPRSFSFNDVPLRSANLQSAGIRPREQLTTSRLAMTTEQQQLQHVEVVRPPPIVSVSTVASVPPPPQVVPEIPVPRPRRETCSPDRLMIAIDPENITDDESEGEPDSEEHDRWHLSLKESADEDEPMDLSKRSNGDGSGHETEDMDDDMDGLYVPRQDFMPIPLASGAEDGEGKCVCTICNKTFSKPSQLRLHVNIHYFERPYRCESCAVSFRTKGHLQKHKRSVSHYNKVNMNKTFGTPSNDNPRPFKCSDCKVAFRIHGHLAKHLRSKLHIMKLECLNKLPFGMFAEMERSGVNLNDIDTSNCTHSLLSLQALSRRMSALSGSSLDISNTKFLDPSAIALSDEDDDERMQVNESPSKRFKMEEGSTPTRSVTHPYPVMVEDNVRERSMSFSGTPAQPVVSSAPERRVTVFSATPEEISRKVQQEMTGRTAPSTQLSIATRSNTCDICGQVFKSVKFLHVHLYSDHPNHQDRGSTRRTPSPKPPSLPSTNGNAPSSSFTVQCLR